MKTTINTTINNIINMQVGEVALHGEAMIMAVKSLPKTAKAIKPTCKEYMIFAPSETVGNHHVIDCSDSVEFFMDEDGTMYMKSDEPVTARCLHADRHGTDTFAPGIYQFGDQQEYDYLSEELRKVRD